MALDYFDNAVANNMLASPNDMYRNNQQAFIDEQWDNTSAKTPENGGEIQEQSAIGSSVYNIIEAWVKPTVDDVTTGQKDSRDFLKLIFKSIDHTTTRGLFYKFDGCTWLVNNFNTFNGLAQDVGIRRCNNLLKIIDPLNGAVFSIPCVVDYDMMSPANQVGRYVITPNGHITVITQANEDTLRLFVLNKRFVLNGRVFRINAYQNSLDFNDANQQPTILYLDMYLDEIHGTDDMQNQIADNGDFVYTIKLNSDNFEAPTNTQGTLTADVLLNGEKANREIVWSSSNAEVVSIDESGNYIILGEDGETAEIFASIKGNEQIVDSIIIEIANTESFNPKIIIDPPFESIRQFETLSFEIYVQYGNQIYRGSDLVSNIVVDDVDLDYIDLSKNNNFYTITCNKIKLLPSKIKLTISAEYDKDGVQFSASTTQYVSTVSMFG